MREYDKYVIRPMQDPELGQWYVIQTETTCSTIAEFELHELDIAKRECKRMNAELDAEIAAESENDE